MAKDSYYFPHDYNARNDRKIAALIQKHKAAGYGVFWITCEMMHEEDGNIEFDDITFGAIAKDSNECVDFVRIIISDCITEFKLFKREDDIVLSGRVSRNLDYRRDAINQRSEAGKRSAVVRRELNGRSTDDERNSTKKGKERKGNKEIRGVRFDDFGKNVFFEDGSFQELGLQQARSYKEGDYKPHFIIKGVIE